MNEDIKRIADALERYAMQNHRPAVDEPANEFEKVVNSHAEMQAAIAEVKSLLKPLEAAERRMRDGLADSLNMFFGKDLKEGTNKYELSNGRFLKYGHKIDRKVDEAMIAPARDAYMTAEDKPPAFTFDQLFRVKHEIAKANFNKLLPGGQAATALSRCIVTKPAAPTIEVD